MRQKKAVTRELRDRYRKSSKKEKTIMLDEFIRLTRYSRSYAARALRLKEVLGYMNIRGKRVRLVRDKRKIKRKKKKIYDEGVLVALKEIWKICDYICSKRLAPFLSEIIPALERWGEINLSAKVREKLFKISAATIDRLLTDTRKRYRIKGRSTTRPGTLLKKSIPIRTFADWDEAKPGFFEADLVSHDGGAVRGDFIQSLNFTDISTGWEEMIAVKNKAQRWVFSGIETIKERLPFSILGIDSDNGAEFINAHLIRYCEEHKITFTRSRPYRKNDSCFVEQKNWSVIRRAVGYARYDTDKELSILNELYVYLRLYVNFFQPVRKLIKKERIGSKVIKRYDEAKTPYRRVLASPDIEDEIKMKLKSQYAMLNPAELKRKITKLQDKLLKLNALKQKVREDLLQKSVEPSSRFEYIST
ncbi:transposase family protein [Candidatus Oleimmundimicrobium sp.]|uniref:integrase catalytic domain-containing protein n=1 Tax=Candidatus Oleimmundimicrobium sp. TaxID=3060597 RepID=UPI002723A495|nr:transposase family protein [Candidatus Oleimmundimicrobium sp.]MDO8886749.1 transposase family protein [Candidatus Oleimmundimicrobium sp.]